MPDTAGVQQHRATRHYSLDQFMSQRLPFMRPEVGTWRYLSGAVLLSEIRLGPKGRQRQRWSRMPNRVNSAISVHRLLNFTGKQLNQSRHVKSVIDTIGP